ncbi:MAG: helix-turn-helix domain-containing protein [Candidatus Moranbacteria bacterium]|jgi:cytoskeletal protein RodZ|nr:helix-turn-helix domain-containing protein [Candidatus Moranbacteria bacterium]
MNGFKVKKVRSLTLGEKMRRIRNEKRVILPEIAKNTKIQLEYLEYLENGDYNKLPADVYVKGFLKSFADYLGVNEEYLIKSFNKEKSIQKNIEGGSKEKIKPNKINLSRFAITPKIISIFFISLFFLALMFYLYKNLNNFVSNPELIIMNPAADSIINDTKVLVKGKTDIGNDLFINNQLVLVDDDGVFSENVVLREGKNVIIVKSVNQFNKEVVQSISVEAHYSTQEPAPFENPVPQEEQKVEENNPGTDAPEEVKTEEPVVTDSEVLGADSVVPVEEEKTDKKKKK